MPKKIINVTYHHCYAEYDPVKQSSLLAKNTLLLWYFCSPECIKWRRTIWQNLLCCVLTWEVNSSNPIWLYFQIRTSGIVLNDYCGKPLLNKPVWFPSDTSLLKILGLQVFEGRTYMYIFSIQQHLGTTYISWTALRVKNQTNTKPNQTTKTPCYIVAHKHCNKS